MADRYLKRRWSSAISTKSFSAHCGVTPFAIASYQLLHTIASRTKLRNKHRSTTLPTTLRHFILYIIFVCTKEQMIRIYTDRVVAFVKNVHRFIVLSKGKLIANPVWRGVFTLKPELTIKSRLTAPSFSEPFPAIIGLFFVYFIPESFNIRGIHGYRLQNLGGFVNSR